MYSIIDFKEKKRVYKKKKKARIEKFSFFCIIKRLFGVFGSHVAFNEQTHHFGLGVGAQRNGLLEVSGVFACTVVGNLDGSGLSGHHRLFVYSGHCASARCHCLMDYQRSVSPHW